MTSLLKTLAVAASGPPSRSKSPTATDQGPDAGATENGEPGAGVKPARPSPSSAVMSLDCKLAVAMSRCHDEAKMNTTSADDSHCNRRPLKS